MPGLFERFHGESPEDYLKKVKAQGAETSEVSKPESEVVVPPSATHVESIEAWQNQPDANDPASRAADRIALERAKEVEQAQAEGQAETPEKSN